MPPSVGLVFYLAIYRMKNIIAMMNWAMVRRVVIDDVDRTVLAGAEVRPEDVRDGEEHAADEHEVGVQNSEVVVGCERQGLMPKRMAP